MTDSPRYSPHDILANRLFHEFERFSGTSRPQVHDLPTGFWQHVSDHDSPSSSSNLMVEIGGTTTRADGRDLDAVEQATLRSLGFHEPDDDSPNWYRYVDEVTEDDLREAARATASALLTVLGVAPSQLGIAALRYQPPAPTTRRTPALLEPTPCATVTTDAGAFVAHLDGRVVNDAGQTMRIFRWWSVDGAVLEVDLLPRDDFHPRRRGTLPDTKENRRLLRRLAPGDEVDRLTAQLLVMEYWALWSIQSGTCFHSDFYAAAHIRTPQATNIELDDLPDWPLRDRFEAVQKAMHHYSMWLGADRHEESYSDELSLWATLQEWVHLTPWVDEFTFAIEPDAERIRIHRLKG